ASRRRSVCSGARDADVARPLLPSGARLVDQTDVRQALWRARRAERRDDRAPLQALRRVGRARVLALPDAQLGRRRVAGLVTVLSGAAGAGATIGLQNQYGVVARR